MKKKADRGYLHDITRLIEAAEAVDAEASQEGARALHPEEIKRIKDITTELQDLSLAILYDSKIPT